MLRNLGQIASALAKQIEADHFAHEDVDAFGAPSECHDIVAEGNRRAALALVDDLEKNTGYRAEELLAEFKARVSGRWLYMHDILRPILEALDAREEVENRRQRLKHANRARLPH